jgi:hypothetical protein
MTHQLLKPFVTMVAAALVAGCTMKKQEAPPLAGPSEFGTSIAVSATPDVIFQDGASQSLVVVMARDPNGQGVRNLSLRAEIAVDGSVMDFGTLSARSIVTGNDGRATLVYTAPASPAGFATDAGTVVQVLVTPVGSDFGNSVARQVSIRLVPPGIIIPPDGMQPRFTMTPAAPADHEPVLFDASTSESAANNPIRSMRWNFGDGDTGEGRTAVHSYDAPGVYVVTLTVFDAFNRSASTSQTISVGAGVGPTASFVFSPTEPMPSQQVNFNASSSTAAPGRRIVSYVWDFGDGSPTASGVQASHTYTVVGTYVVTLVVTDDVGRTSSVSRDVPVGIVEDDGGD